MYFTFQLNMKCTHKYPDSFCDFMKEAGPQDQHKTMV